MRELKRRKENQSHSGILVQNYIAIDVAKLIFELLDSPCDRFRLSNVSRLFYRGYMQLYTQSARIEHVLKHATSSFRYSKGIVNVSSAAQILRDVGTKAPKFTALKRNHDRNIGIVHLKENLDYREYNITALLTSCEFGVSEIQYLLRTYQCGKITIACTERNKYSFWANNMFTCGVEKEITYDQLLTLIAPQRSTEGMSDKMQCWAGDHLMSNVILDHCLEDLFNDNAHILAVTSKFVIPFLGGSMDIMGYLTTRKYQYLILWAASPILSAILLEKLAKVGLQIGCEALLPIIKAFEYFQQPDQDLNIQPMDEGEDQDLAQPGMRHSS